MKLSFSLQSKPKPKPQPTSSSSQPAPELITEFDPSKPQTSSQPKQIIIPPIQNEWRPHKRLKNLSDLPSSLHPSSNLEFEPETSDSAPPPDDNISYGLNLRRNSENNIDKKDASVLELRRFKADVERLADESVDDYDDVGVEEFAKALLMGYGWKEGRGIGKNAKEDVKAVEYKRRTALEGLGFTAESAKAMPKSMGKDEVVKVGVGKEVRVVSGNRDLIGVKGRVVEVLDGGIALLKVEKRDEEVRVRVGDVAELGSVEEETCVRKLKELRLRESRSSDDDSRKKESSVRESRRDDDDSRRRRSEKTSKDKDSSRKSSDRDSSRKRREKKEVDGVVGKSERRGEKVSSWIMSSIRVRVISEEFKGGRYYLKKGKVVDVVGPGVCDILMDDGGKLVQGVDQGILETALPRKGGRVLVLLGKHKGVVGDLVEKDPKRDTGVVQDADSLELINVRLEQIAEFLGD